MTFMWPNEFIELDVRNRSKSKWQSYQISQDFFWHRHSNTLPADTLRSKTLLDLGCYIGATGHWALEHGCLHYTGIELITQHLQHAKQLLSKYHHEDKFSLVQAEIGKFLTTFQQHYDIVVAWGVLNTFVDPIPVIQNLLRISDRVLIDSPIPRSIKDIKDYDNQRALIELNPMSCQMQITNSNPTTFRGSRISMRAIEMIGEQSGFRSDRVPNSTLSQALPYVYGPDSDCLTGSDSARAMTVLIRDPDLVAPKTYQEIYG